MRTRGSYGPKTQTAIYRAATKLIAQRGYDGVSLRDIARATGLNVSSLYNHIPTKQALLYKILEMAWNELIANCRAALGKEKDPVALLRAFVRTHMRFMMNRRDQLVISYSEAKSLTKTNFQRLIKLHDQYHALIQGILERGMEAKIFAIPNIHLSHMLITDMLTAACVWAKKSDEKKLEKFYFEMCLRVLGATTVPRNSVPWALTPEDLTIARPRHRQP